MPKPITYEVAPSANHWLVRMAGDSQSEGFATKGEAIARARQLAAHYAARIRVLTEAGIVEREYEPPPPGTRP